MAKAVPAAGDSRSWASRSWTAPVRDSRARLRASLAEAAFGKTAIPAPLTGARSAIVALAGKAPPQGMTRMSPPLGITCVTEARHWSRRPDWPGPTTIATVGFEEPRSRANQPAGPRAGRPVPTSLRRGSERVRRACGPDGSSPTRAARPGRRPVRPEACPAPPRSRPPGPWRRRRAARTPPNARRC